MRSATIDDVGAMPGRPRSRRQGLLAMHLVAAVVLGFLADTGLRSGEQLQVVFVSATPWALLAFSAGRASGSLFRSPAAGALVLTVGLFTYYAWLHLGNDVSAGTLTGSGYRGYVWLGAGLAVGAVAGFVGGLTVGGGLLADLAWCGAVAVPLAEAVVQLRYSGMPTLPVAIFFAAVVSAVLVLAVRTGARWWFLLASSPVAALAVYELQLLVLQHVFHRLTWI